MSSSSPISPVVDHLADLALWEAELAADSATAGSVIAESDGVAVDPLSVASSLLSVCVVALAGLCDELLPLVWESPEPLESLESLELLPVACCGLPPVRLVRRCTVSSPRCRSRLGPARSPTATCPEPRA